LRVHTPLRYPGGKARLGPFLGELVRVNGLSDGSYVEPYAGGAGAATYLMFGEFVDTIYINDLDERIFAFWLAILDHSDAFCRLLERVPITTKEWYRQKRIFNAGSESSDALRLGFATFYLNRTNRSGILNGGMIGGKRQRGEWLLDARFNRDKLIDRIQRISRYRRRIRVSNEDALEFMTRLRPTLSSKTLLYLDPPYYSKAQHLYSNFYLPDDHRHIAEFVSSLTLPWVITYDDHTAIRSLYSGFRRFRYSLDYSARVRRSGSEVMFFSHGLSIPDTSRCCGLGRRPPTPASTHQAGRVATVRVA